MLTNFEALAWWRNKIQRRFYSPYNKLVHRGSYFICRYFGAEFLVHSASVGGLEISAKIAEYPELKNFMRSAAAIKTDIFIDIGANLGLYTCILMKNRLVPRAILFEPDRRNRVHLGANLLINGLLDANLEIHPVALGAEPGRFRLVPGPERDIGFPGSSRPPQKDKATRSRSCASMILLRSPAKPSQSRLMSSATNAKCSPGWRARCVTIAGSCKSRYWRRARRQLHSWLRPDSGWRKISGPISYFEKIERLKPQVAPTHRQ